MMGIPTWLRETSGTEDSSGLSAAELEAVSETLEVLANPVRLEILDTLAGRDGPVRYSDLREALSIRDKGRLNYHLRQLEGLVESDDGRYALTDRGRRLAEQVTDETLR